MINSEIYKAAEHLPTQPQPSRVYIIFSLSSPSPKACGQPVQYIVSVVKSRAWKYRRRLAIYGRQFFPQELPVANLTHVLYAFANIDPESGAQMYILKKQNRNLKVLLSIGGWTYSSNFPAAASTISKRATFASSVVSLVQNLGLDGIDVDWEYPSDDTEANDFVLLLQEVRDALDRFGDSLQSPYHFLLTVASPASPAVCQNWKLSEMDQYVDFWNFMAYDYSGPWSTVSAHQANLSPSGNGSTPFNTQTGISYYIAHGITSAKIVLGMPIYGRSFEQTNGLDQSFQGVGQGTWASGVYDYKALPLAGATEVYDKKIGASYSWDTSKREIISYDNPMVAIQKAQWIQSMNLGGAMWWESSADGQGSRSLIGSVMSVLGGHMQNVTNQLSFPNSTYANIRNGMPGFSKLPLLNITSPKISTCYSTKAYTSSGSDIPPSLLGITTTSSPMEVTTAVGSSQGTTTAGSSKKTTAVASSKKTTAVASSQKTTAVASSQKTTAVASSQGTTTVSDSSSVTNVCSLVSDCSIVTTLFSYSTSTPITLSGTTSTSFSISTDSATLCICNSCFFDVRTAVSGASTTTYCGNTISVPAGFTKIINGKLPISTTTTTMLPIPTAETITAITTTTILSPKRRSGCNPNLECYTSSTSIVGPGYSPTGLICTTDTNNDPLENQSIQSGALSGLKKPNSFIMLDYTRSQV
ncbi:hypothetical protein SS1G_08020 [Sclerotinia sclerotiorum 1980 UF-70]|uniref:chitinase n=1 Tax=Sclerotinia sclerotiorum (strain ATCC 18683 / 1980 / Ss-1) TaxID=665079 RepID=A7ERR6_SCLS1|nr:hypothetical protein SS1G_08020 [Sclerotinia sclerotiorum 1980 UF-70]EDN92158.1 hypothetical protein SS1G_08020 [Sclerotinia sclerotiorum 1980 UF-70]